MKGNKLTLSLFNITQTKEIAKLLEFDLRKTKCCICNKRLHSEDIGHFVHLDHKPATICTDRDCFKNWMIIEKLDIFTLFNGAKKQ